MPKIKQINEYIAIKLTLMMSSIWCVYLFFLWSVLPLVAPNLEAICMYVSSTVIQLVALPALAVGQNLLSQASEQRAAQDHAAVMEIVTSIHTLLNEEDETVSDIVDIKNQIATIKQYLKIP